MVEPHGIHHGGGAFGPHQPEVGASHLVKGLSHLGVVEPSDVGRVHSPEHPRQAVSAHIQGVVEPHAIEGVHYPLMAYLVLERGRVHGAKQAG